MSSIDDARSKRIDRKIHSVLIVIGNNTSPKNFYCVIIKFENPLTSYFVYSKLSALTLIHYKPTDGTVGHMLKYEQKGSPSHNGEERTHCTKYCEQVSPPNSSEVILEVIRIRMNEMNESYLQGL